MKNKRKYISIIIIFIMLLNLYILGLANGKEGIIRDEYGITGKETLMMTKENIFVFCFALITILLNLFSLSVKNIKKALAYFIIIFSISMAVLLSTIVAKVNYKINHFHPQNIIFEEPTLDDERIS